MNASETKTIELAKALVARPSITPKDEGCQVLIAERLKKIGFKIHHLPFENVDNLFAIRGDNPPTFAFAGHTDVVPTGPLDKWDSPPFSPTIKNGLLYGRGAADMKGSVAAMVVAFENFLEKHPNHPGSLAIILTSDEEGPAHHGTKRVMEYLKEQGILINYCIVGEPSSLKQLGDNIKIGRRGSMSGKLTILGIQGHIAYPHKAINPIHLAMKPLLELVSTTWDQGNQFFPPTSFQISNISAGTGAGNVIPGHLECDFNLRFSTEQNTEKLQAKILSILNAQDIKYEIEWKISGQPFLAQQGKLLSSTIAVIDKLLKLTPSLTTDGGTSDARFIAPAGGEVIELGPCNSTIHQINECVSLDDLNQLTTVYEAILEKLLLPL
jgi:succinyl-diaminopimelate desuccinylase